MKNALTLIIYFFIITFISCADNKNLNEANDTSFVNSSKDGIELIGRWSICTTQSGNGDSIITTSVNVCTIIDFSMDNKAIVTIPSGDTEYFRWIANKNEITLLNTNKSNKDNAYFEDGKYEMQFTKFEKTDELRLMLKAKHYTYILVRCN